ncbi:MULTISPECIES: cation acetate symporter [unclassified Virgibacillus]|uniref:solute symporter family protein n=1 Tax=unclassified Virgibacillus TaxID=2620237 RepID=UPI00090B9263|nr:MULTISPECIES: cation acetate symporter [unclassified Virgibacillus]API91141.1 cation acetate symporter [Virgibacillus sp. 6R]MBS7429130.1 cation acetate symporter [Virgibacillus sp. 19R1-5]
MNLTYFLFFICIIVCTLIITYWAAKRSKTANRFYTAAGSLTGLQNGMAIAGDFISAASFLGIVGAIALHGYDGFLYSIGFLVSYLVVLYLIAEPVHHLGKYSLGDVICARFPGRQMRLMMAISAFIISILYMIPQLVASGLLIRLLLNTDYSISVVVIGSLMTIYVVFGGMLATSWVQIVKTVVLMSGTFLLSLIVFSHFNWKIEDLLVAVKKGTPLGEAFFLAGHLFQQPLEMLSMQLALILGTAGLPHILIRLFTVKNILEVRRSITSATWIIGIFYFMTLVLGLGTIAILGFELLITTDSTGNLAAPLLAQAVGGDFLLAFISAIAFTTIVAVISGLVISATSAFSHDVYHHLIRKGKSTEKEQLQAARWTALGIGLISTLFALQLENINVTFLVSLTFIVAASSNFPILLLTIHWKRFNKTGVLIGMISGLTASIIFVALGPHIMNTDGGWIPYKPIFTLYNPGIIVIPIGFLGAIIGSYVTRGREKWTKEKQAFFLRAQTGVTTRRERS